MLTQGLERSQASANASPPLTLARLEGPTSSLPCPPQEPCISLPITLLLGLSHLSSIAQRRMQLSGRLPASTLTSPTTLCTLLSLPSGRPLMGSDPADPPMQQVFPTTSSPTTLDSSPRPDSDIRTASSSISETFSFHPTSTPCWPTRPPPQDPHRVPESQARTRPPSPPLPSESCICSRTIKYPRPTASTSIDSLPASKLGRP